MCFFFNICDFALTPEQETNKEGESLHLSINLNIFFGVIYFSLWVCIQLQNSLKPTLDHQIFLKIEE